MEQWYNNEMKYFDRQKIVEERKEIFKLLDGDVFYDMKRWPNDVEKIFWQKPMSDTNTFKVVLFFVGNGCPPELINKWIMLSQHWSSPSSKCLKRARQLDYMNGKLDVNGNKWFYFDLHIGRLVYLNGTLKNE